MSPFWGDAVGVFILIMMATFIGIWVWAWRPRHDSNFRRMARLPMECEVVEQRTHREGGEA